MTTFMAYMATLVAAWVVGAWMLMLGVGVVHAEWIPQLPTIGFGLALLLGFLGVVRAVLGAFFGQLAKAIGGENR